MQSADDIRDKRFLIALRGYDRDEVESYLAQIADQVATLQAELAAAEEARDKAVASAASSGGAETSAPASAPAPASDSTPALGTDRMSLIRTLGEETTRILTVAEESAESIVSKAEREAHELRTSAEADTTSLRETTAAEVEQLRSEADADATRMRDEAKAAARAEAEQANRQAARVVSEAERRRDRVAAEIQAVNSQRQQLIEDLRAAVTTVTSTVAELEQGNRDGGGDQDDEEPAPAAAASAPVAEPVTEPVAETEPEREPVAEPEVVAEPEPEPEPEAEPVAETEPEVVAEPEPEPTVTEPAAQVEPEVVPATESVAEAVLASEDDLTGQAREAIEMLSEEMTRDLKRGLQSIQSSILETIRSSEHPTLDELLPAELLLDEIATLASSHFEDAYTVAVIAATEHVGGEVPSSLDDSSRVPAATATFRAVLAHEVTSSLRPTLRAGLDADESATSLSERVGEVFRDLKGPVLTSVSVQHLSRSYGHGLVDAWNELGVSQIVWQLGEEKRCPEKRCAANVDAGPTAIGEDFPSGDRVPPAHPGCTCTVVPA